MRAPALAVLIGLALVPRAWADFANGQNASIVIGKPDFTTSSPTVYSSTGLLDAWSIAFSPSGELWVGEGADNGGGRAVRFSPPFSTGMAATLVLGADDFSSSFTSPPPGVPDQKNICQAASVATDSSGNVWVGDSCYSRVLMFAPPLSNGMNASLVIGDASFTSTAPVLSQSSIGRIQRGGTSIAFDAAGNLWVADVGFFRVLRYSPPFSSGMSASLVLGQANFTSSGTACTASGFGPGAPAGLAFDSSGSLWVSDYRRVLRFTAPFTNGMSASLVLGQADFTTCPDPPPSQSQSTLIGPRGVTFDPLGNIWVTDWNRVLRFAPPFSNGMNASLVLGQTVFTSTQAATTQSGMNDPVGIAYRSGSIWVSEFASLSGRVKRFDNVPSSATNVSAVALASSTAQLSWTATDNPFGASFAGSYAIQHSSDAAAAFSTTAAQVALSTSSVAPLAAQARVVGGLLANTTYFFRIWSANEGLNYSPVSAGATVATLAQAPLTNAPAFLGVFGTSVAAQWVALAAAPSSATAEGYRLEGSSTNFGAGTVYSSATTAVSLSTLTVQGLTQNTTYFFRAGSLNWASVANFTALGATVTAAAAPSALAIGAVSSASVALSWSANGNPNWTPYELSLSTDNFQTSVSTPVAFAANLTASATTLNLAGGTTYYFRVQARNWASVPTAFSATASTVTLPGLLTSISTSAPSTTALTWTWTNTAGPAVQHYVVYAASNGAQLGTTGPASFGLTGLSTNTAYGVRIGAVDASGPGPLSAAVTGYTLAAPSTGSAFTAVHLSSVTLSWGANGNPGSTVYEVHRSTDNVAFAVISSQTATLFTDTQIGNATFYYKLRAKNGDGVATAFDVTLSTFLPGTPPGPPSGLLASNPSGGLVTLSWSGSAGPDLLHYRIYWDAGTGAVNYSVAYTTVAASTSSATIGPLAAGTYYFAIRAKNTILLEENNTGVRASVTIPAAAPFTNWVQAQIQAPQAGKKVWGNRVTMLANIIRGGPASASQVSFQYRSAVSTTTPWIAMPAVLANNPRTAPPYLIHWDVTALAQGDYELRAVASNSSGQADPAAPTRLMTVGSASPDIEQSLQGASVLYRERVSNAAASTLVLGSLTGDQYHQLVLPTGALGATPSTVLRVLHPPASVPAAPAELSPVDVFYDIMLENGQTALSASAWLTAFYKDADTDGLVDGTFARADRLKFMVYDTAGARWRQEAPSTLDSVSKSVAAPTSHFSLFGLFAPSAVNLDSVRVYPVPYFPSDKVDDNGKPFSASDPDSGIIFDNITQAIKIEVYTVSGSLVWRGTSANSSGKVQWDARNMSGQDVAPGGYIAVIRDAQSGQKVIRKLAIIR